LAQIGDLRALRNLATLLSDPASEVRLEVLDALVRFNDPRVLSLLAKCASIDPSLEVRERAVRAHGAIARAHQRGAEAISLGRVDSLVDLTQLDRLSGLLVRARDQGGSDVHLKMGLRPLIRLNGKLQPLDQAEITVPQMQDLLLLALNPRQRLQFEQQLQLDFCYIVPNVGRYRANIYQDRLGVGAVFRIIPNRIPTLDELGIPPVVRRISEYRQGLVVLSGSASCGKTTTLAALVDLLNETRQSHILTLEDPIEFVHGFKNSLVDQREVGKHTQSFASALKAAMREDPDVIVVGEMRDTETLGLALNASSTGHLVVGTLHTSSAHKTVDRLIESFSPGEQQQVRLMLAESLKTVICQSLLPTADGTGRVAAFEILFHTGSLANLIRDNKTIMIPSIMQTGRAQGMRTLDDSLRELLEKKRITPEVAYARATNKEDFEPNLDGKAREAIQLVAREVGPA
ncbi:MAG: PilT/PilU family type 4a pilus ATPase, partial [Deltaproteobacteria bacterium]|nr:PilT/PilU family type 4a pilus ATPase [Deltaproteobacteria bacterium]